MHILTSTSASLDDLAEPVDLRQSPGDIVALSFSDSDLSGIAAAHAGFGAPLPSMRLAALRDLRHPMSVDLWLDSVAAHAKVILVRILGGYEWWRYGCDQLAALARSKGIALAMLPGECRDSDARLIECSTLPVETLDGLLDYFREGGPANMTALVARLATLAGAEAIAAAPVEVPKAGCYEWRRATRTLPAPGRVAAQRPGGVAHDTLDALDTASPVDPTPPGQPAAGHPPPEGEGTPIVPVLFYRSMLLASDVAPIDALCAALASKGLRPVPIFVASLKEPTSVAFVEKALADLKPAAIVTCTAFATGAEAGGQTMFDRAGVPVFQAVVATTRREAWQSGPRGLAPSDLAMHVVMPELDGRLLAGVVSFKARQTADATLGFGTTINLPEPDRIDQVAARIASFLHLAATPPADRRIAILMPDYPGAPGRTGYAVGLDVPSSVIAMLQDLKTAGYGVEAIPDSPRDLLRLLDRGDHGLSQADYVALVSEVPAEAMEKVEEAWGTTRSLPLRGRVAAQRPGGVVSDTLDALYTSSPAAPTPPGQPAAGHPPPQGEGSPNFPFRAATFGNVTVMLAPDRGRSADRRADYHDASLPPHHALLAFGLWLRHRLGVHALVHLGAHGTLEWLPGKTVALSRTCFPEIVTGGLPVVYPFIVSNPGEAAQAKRRIAAVTIGHLPPPLSHAGLDENQQKLERLVDEYAQADGLDRRRRDRLAKLIVDTAATTGLATEAGVTGTDAPDEALRRIDAWLCDLKDLAVKDGLHIFGRSAEDEADPARLASASAERSALLAALSGRHIPAGPAGAPARGRADVLPTGRNLFTADPRSMPTPTAFDLGKAAAEDVLRRYLQDHGDWPRALVIDLWGSASLRTGGEEIAQGLFLMGCRPQWEPSTGRVTGVKVLPQATIGRPRIDVTWRISGLFRDMFPTQIALLDAAAAAVAACEEEEADNPLRAATLAEGTAPARIFGASPGVYGAGVEDLLSSGDWESRDEIGRAYLAAASHAYGGAEGEARAAPGAFEKRIAAADLLVHTGDDPGRDILEGSADVAFVGGFTAAMALLGRNADVIVLDTTDPARPRPRSITEAVTRVVRARAANPRFIAGQMRHGPRGASEFAETVDRLVGFAETTGAVPGTLIEAVHDAYLGDEAVRAFILRENPAAAIAIAERLASARRRGLWHPLRNSIDDDLAALIAEARVLEQAA
jgi:cobaltochelatase CobN